MSKYLLNSHAASFCLHYRQLENNAKRKIQYHCSTVFSFVRETVKRAIAASFFHESDSTLFSVAAALSWDRTVTYIQKEKENACRLVYVCVCGYVNM